MSTLAELFEALKKQNTKRPTLSNTKETWKRIGEKDNFSELGFTSVSEKDDFLKEWMENNPYSNIK